MVGVQKRKIQWAISLSLIMLYFSGSPVHAKYGGGTGEPNDPYQIATADDLMLLGDNPEDYDKHFILVTDIDLDPNLSGRKVFDKAIFAPHTNDEAYRFEGTPFTGVFNGNSHTISHLTIEGKSYLGLFGRSDSGAIISNLGLQAVDVNGTRDHVGGLIGDNYDGSITMSYSTGTVSGDNFVGGLVGRIGSFASRGAVLTNCYSTGAVSGISSVGGLVGDNFGSIATSYSACRVRGERLVGGLMGSNGLSELPTGGILTDCYSTGIVDGEEFVGGLAGGSAGSITNSYSTGAVNGTRKVGGLVGDNIGSISTSFWDMENSGQTSSSGGTGLSTVEMMDPEMLGLNGLADNPNWILDAYRDYPRLAWEGTVGDMIPWPAIHWLDGNGTVESPHEIATVDQLSRLSRAGALTDRHFILVNDLDLSGLSWSQAVIPYFTGYFDGNGYVISDLHIQGTNGLGLIGHLGRDAIITNIGLKDVSIEGTDKVGSLVGRNDGSLSNSYCTGTVTGDWYVGGLIGGIGSWESRGVVITNCYNTCTVSGKTRVGGLVGNIYKGTIATSYSTGMVTGTGDVGGLVGHNGGSITRSFWDIETSGLTNMCGGQRGGVGCDDSYGKTTAEMQTASTFLEAGWDFIDETTNGTEDVWSICEGTNYPRLSWQIPAGDFVCPDGITIEDFVFFIEHWRDDNCDSSNDYCQGTDLDFSGTVDAGDLEILVANWLAQPIVPPQQPVPPQPPQPPKGRACFLADTPVWVNEALVQISNVVSERMVGEPHCDLATSCLEQLETVEEHEGTFECRDVVLESGNRISVVDAHCFMLDSGQWIAAQDLRSGLRLKTLSGTVGIKSVATRAAPFVGKVYNLKIKGGDQYFVGKDRIIVRDY
ncbi:MAG: GLUG motif-containing protein [Planctomycetota bacterium]